MTDSATRAAMVAHTRSRKDARRAKNDARAEANLARLAALGGERRMYERVTTQTIWWPNPVTLRDVRERFRMKLESPGTALARTLRERRS